MTDRLGQLLAHAADQHTLDAVPPPMPPEWQVSAARSSRRRRTWTPLLAAAAVIAVAVPVVLVSRVAGPDPITVVGAPAQIDPDGPSRGAVRSIDAGLPDFLPFGPDPSLKPCGAQALSATLDLSLGLLRLALAPSTNACALPERVDLDLAGSVTVEHLVQPPLPNPPSFDGRMLDASGVLLNATWAGSCATPTAGVLRGIGSTPVPVEVNGTPAGCRGDAPARLALGPAHRPGSPGAIVPADRARLQVDLTLPEQVRDGEPIGYTVTLTNPTQDPIALSPCPTFTYRLMLSDGSGSGDRGRLPCEDLPDAVPARSAVQVRGELLTPATRPGTGPGEVTLAWQIAGPEEVTATAQVVRAAPRELGTLPYLPPGQGTMPAPGSFRYRSSGGELPVRIEGPTTVKAGEVLRYRAVLTNPGGADPIPLRPCPGWTETFVAAPKSDNSHPTPAIRRGAIDCAAAPESIQSGEQIAFEMELPVPAGAPAGAYQIFWQLDGGIDSGPFDLTVTS